MGMKKVNVVLKTEAICICPYCDAMDDAYEYIQESLWRYGDQIDNCNIKYTCSECDQVYLIENVES